MAPRPKPAGKSVTTISDNPRQPWAPREGIAVPMVDPEGEVVFSYEDNPDIILHGPPNETPVEAWRRDISNQEQFIALVEDHNRALAYAISEREKAAERERIAQQKAEEERAANEALARARTASAAPRSTSARLRLLPPHPPSFAPIPESPTLTRTVSLGNPIILDPSCERCAKMGVMCLYTPARAEPGKRRTRPRTTCDPCRALKSKCIRQGGIPEIVIPDEAEIEADEDPATPSPTGDWPTDDDWHAFLPDSSDSQARLWMEQLKQGERMLSIMEELLYLSFRQESREIARWTAGNNVASSSSSHLTASRISKRPSNELDDEIEIQQSAPAKKAKKMPAGKGKVKETEEEEEEDRDPGADESGDDF